MEYYVAQLCQSLGVHSADAISIVTAGIVLALLYVVTHFAIMLVVVAVAGKG